MHLTCTSQHCTAYPLLCASVRKDFASASHQTNLRCSVRARSTLQSPRASSSPGPASASQTPVPSPWGTEVPAARQPTDWVTDSQGKDELIQLIASRGFGVFDGNTALAAQRVDELRSLLPGLSLRAAERSSHPLVKALADMERTLERLLRLQQLLPDVDVATLVSKRLDLLLEEPEEVDKAVRRKAEAVGFDLADADQWFVNSPDAWHERHWLRRQRAQRR